MLGDNKALYTSVQQIGATSRTRYYERAVLLFKRAVLLLILVPYLVTTDNMLADIFTKSVERGTFVRLRNHMMNIHGTLRQQLEANYSSAVGAVRRRTRMLYDAITGKGSE